MLYVNQAVIQRVQCAVLSCLPVEYIYIYGDLISTQYSWLKMRDLISTKYYYYLLILVLLRLLNVSLLVHVIRRRKQLIVILSEPDGMIQ